MSVKHFLQYSRVYKGIFVVFSGYFVFAACNSYSDPKIDAGEDEKVETSIEENQDTNSSTLEQHDANETSGLSESFLSNQSVQVLDNNAQDIKHDSALRDIKVSNSDAVYVDGIIKNNFYTSAIDIGIPVKVVKSFIGILGKRVNFRSGLRNGDSFAVVYDKKTYVVLYLQISVRGKQITAYKGVNSDNKYYFKDGTPIDTNVVFFKKPIEKARISSPYGYRLHPILGVVKKHSGIDYAAPYGTPVYAACDGIIKKRGYDNYSGKHVVVKHSNGYETVYAHLSSFENVKIGEHILCGSRIGRVGSTGRSTGAHLHYAVRKNGVYVNPAKAMSIRGHVKLCSSKYRNFTNSVDSAIRSVKASGSNI